MEQPHLITVIGLKRTGKTSVVEALVSELRARGHDIGTVKTMKHHHLSLDARETDTHRHAEAGASVVVALHSDGTARFEKGTPPKSLEEVSRLFPEGIRILICEGAIDPSEPCLVVLCLNDLSKLEETLRTRRISRNSVAAISGKGAAAWDPALLPGIPSFDVMDPVQRRALVDLLLGKIAQAKKDHR
jgi:molybdopterin-guanine dinucleotide biosynthesis protein B